MTSRKNQDKEGRKPAGESEASVNPKRRRLIKGLAAATPGIFTLHSGAAQAMLSSRQCTAKNQQDFDGKLKYASEDRYVGKNEPYDDNFVRLAEQDGIYVVREINSTLKEEWLVSVIDEEGGYHHIEANHDDKPASGATWNDVLLRDKEWLPTDDSGAGVPGSPLKLKHPDSGQVYTQRFDKSKTIRLFACVDDDGNLFSAYPRECDAQGFAPPSGSCWASIGTSTMNHWWG